MSSKIEDNKKISNDIEMSFSEHVEEFRQRLFFSLIIFSTITVGCFYFLDSIVEIVKSPAVGIKFFQFAPGEYFFTSIKLVIYSGSVLSSPIFIYQILLFLLPGMTYQEQKIIVPLLSISNKK